MLCSLFLLAKYIFKSLRGSRTASALKTETFPVQSTLLVTEHLLGCVGLFFPLRTEPGSHTSWVSAVTTELSSNWKVTAAINAVMPSVLYRAQSSVYGLEVPSR